MKFSFIFPSRGRTAKLRRTLASIAEMTRNKANVEVLIAVDNDDMETLVMDLSTFFLSVKRVVFNRKEEFAGYYNGLVPHVTGEVVWIWSDENVLATKHWDRIAERSVRGKDVWLGQTSDFVMGNGVAYSSGHPLTKERFPCFPMISKKAIDALGWVHNPFFRMWGADLYNFMVFKQAGLIVNMEKIEVITEDSGKSDKRMDIFREDIKRMIDAGMAKAGEGSEVAYNIGGDLRKLRYATCTPRMYRLDHL